MEQSTPSVVLDGNNTATGRQTDRQIDSLTDLHAGCARVRGVSRGGSALSERGVSCAHRIFLQAGMCVAFRACLDMIGRDVGRLWTNFSVVGFAPLPKTQTCCKCLRASSSTLQADVTNRNGGLT